MKEFLFIGTYSEPIKFGTGETLHGKGQGVHLYAFNQETGFISGGELACKSRNPSFLCVSADGKYLYAVNELKEFAGEKAGAISAYRIHVEHNKPVLTFLSQFSTRGTDPCHVNINKDGTHVYVANFMSGSVTVFPVDETGTLLPSSEFIQHKGSSVDVKRQSSPHAHSVVLTPDEKYALVPDLGIDKLMIYKTDFAAGTLKPAQIPFLRLNPGEGPRFCEFHPNGRFCYLINELASSLSVLYYDAEKGSFARVQTIGTIPADFAEDNICADVHITPDGRFVYASNRGHDSIAIFGVNAENGRLTLLDSVSSGGKTPRNFNLSTRGNYLLVANQDSDNLVSFAIDGETGFLTKVCEVFAPTPVCVIPYKLDSQ